MQLKFFVLDLIAIEWCRQWFQIIFWLYNECKNFFLQKSLKSIFVYPKNKWIIVIPINLVIFILLYIEVIIENSIFNTSISCSYGFFFSFWLRAAITFKPKYQIKFMPTSLRNKSLQLNCSIFKLLSHFGKWNPLIWRHMQNK